MAVKVFTIDMNGGDETSADTAIYFKIYGSADSYTTAIATTGVHGTTGVSVSAGTATVTWEVGTETAFKVTQVDEAGNESVASAEYDTAGSSYLFEDLFTGTGAIDAAKWPVIVNPTPANVSFAYNNSLECDTYGNVSDGLMVNYMRGTAIDITTVAAITFDITHPAQTANRWRVGMTNDATPTDNLNSFSILRKTTAGDMYAFTRESGVDILSNIINLDISTERTMKIVNTGTALEWYYWNTSTWTLLDSRTITLSGNYYPFIECGDDLGDVNTMVIKNFRVVDTDFATQRP